ncbi:class I SAM-dependent methyltransferase [Flindersiella endophytica]
MTWPDFASSYDVVAADYAAAFAGELAGKPFDRDLLDRFAAAVAGGGPVWDVGCGAAGHVTRYLADRRVEVVGADISPGSIAQAAKAQPDLEFRVADMRSLPADDSSLRGIVAFYSLIHLPRQELPSAFAEFGRVLAPGGDLLVSMHGGTGEFASGQFLGHAVPFRATLVGLDELAGFAESAGFHVRERQARPPYNQEHPTDRLYLWATA